MSFEVWLLYLLSVTTLVIIPGPTTLLISAYALSRGLGVAFIAMLGVCLADFSSIALSTLGLSAIFKSLPWLYHTIKWLGVAYLLYLGWGLIRSSSSVHIREGLPEEKWWQVGLKAYTVTLLNPKGVLFFSTFLPQFINPKAPVLAQMLVMAGTFTAVGLLVMWGYALGSGYLKKVSGGNMRAVNVSGGVMLIIAALFVGFIHPQ